MTLSRKYYNLIANEIKNTLENNNGNIKQLINALCYEFKNDNYNFNSYRFKKACGLKEEEI